MIHALRAAAVALAETAPDEVDPSTGKGPEWGKAAPIGLLVIVLMGIALVFLLRSMNKHLKKVRQQQAPPVADVRADPPGDATVPEAADPDEPPTDHGPDGGQGVPVEDRTG